MNIAIYLDLPDGGAKRTMDEIIPILSKNNKVSIFSCNSILNNSRFRLLRDIDSLIVSRILQKKLANIINKSNFDICFVTHDRHLQSPWILRFLRKAVVFLCQEPTRAFFEKFLDIDKKLPFLKLIYFGGKSSINNSIKNFKYSDPALRQGFKVSAPLIEGFKVSDPLIVIGLDCDCRIVIAVFFLKSQNFKVSAPLIHVSIILKGKTQDLTPMF